MRLHVEEGFQAVEREDRPILADEIWTHLAVSTGSLAAFHVAFKRNVDVLGWDPPRQGFIDDEAHHDLGTAGHHNGFPRVYPDMVEQQWDNTHPAVPGFVAAVDRGLHFDAGFLPGFVFIRIHQIFGSTRPVQ